eukprot:Skav232172  [mRNA]  locus=scaffold4749:64875:77673:- [translate_table: standard]
MALRLEQETTKEQQVALEERLNRAEKRWEAPKHGAETHAVPKHADDVAAGKERPFVEPSSVDIVLPSGTVAPRPGEDATALHVASELMRRLSAEDQLNGGDGEQRLEKPPKPPAWVSRSRKAPESSPALLALPAPPTASRTPRRPPHGESAQAAARVAKVARAEAEARQKRIKQLQQELVRSREALLYVNPGGAVGVARAVEEAKGQREDEKIDDAPDLSGQQAFLVPRSKSRAQKAWHQETKAMSLVAPPFALTSAKDWKKVAGKDKVSKNLTLDDGGQVQIEPRTEIGSTCADFTLMDAVVFFAGREPKSITLRQILDAKTPEEAANLAYRAPWSRGFPRGHHGGMDEVTIDDSPRGCLSEELPIRYAQRILQIEGLPGWQASSELVEAWRTWIGGDGGDMDGASPVLREFQRYSAGRVIPMLATAIRNLQQTEGYSEAFIVQWLDAFFLSRIGTEMLTSQYMASVKPDASAASRRRRVGVVDYACDPVNICEQAARHARKLCKQHYHDAADVEILVESSIASSFEIEQLGMAMLSYRRFVIAWHVLLVNS